MIELLRQRSRPYLFSNSLAPPIVGGTLKVLAIVSLSTGLLDRLKRNTELFRNEMTAAGFDIPSGNHPIVPIMLGDANLATAMADKLLVLGFYVVVFAYPVVPINKARIRVHSAVHSEDDLRSAVEKFNETRRALT